MDRRGDGDDAGVVGEVRAEARRQRERREVVDREGGFDAVLGEPSGVEVGARVVDQNVEAVGALPDRRGEVADGRQRGELGGVEGGVGADRPQVRDDGVAPRRPSASAISRPMPLVAPVTSATRPPRSASATPAPTSARATMVESWRSAT